MLAIRLQRRGKKKQPVYRFIVSESAKDTQAGALENLGFYNPVIQPKEIKLNEERIKYWLSVGAKPSATVQNLLIEAGIMKEGKRKYGAFFNLLYSRLLQSAVSHLSPRQHRTPFNYSSIFLDIRRALSLIIKRSQHLGGLRRKDSLHLLRKTESVMRA